MVRHVNTTGQGSISLQKVSNISAWMITLAEYLFDLHRDEVMTLRNDVSTSYPIEGEGEWRSL